MLLYSPFVTWESTILSLPLPVMNLLQSGVGNLRHQYCQESTRNSTRNEYFVPVSTAQMFRRCNLSVLPLWPGSLSSGIAQSNGYYLCNHATKKQPDIIFAIRSIITTVLARKFALSDFDHLPTILIRWQERDDVILRCITPLPGVNVLECRQVREKNRQSTNLAEVSGSNCDKQRLCCNVIFTPPT